jgi:sugar transferase EpsL
MAHEVNPRPIPIIKRVFDVFIVLVTSPVTLFLSLIVAILVWIFEGRPIIFSQARPGYGGKIFRMYKFRTMRDERDASGAALSDSLRLTRLGRFLRASSLDELPEMANILLGQMSLVGPRPLLVAYLERYNGHQARRHEVLPGVTGWAQINGRNAITWEQKFDLDVWYVDHWSVGLDLKILWMTVWKVFRREGISQPGQTTSAEFMGTPGSEK